jgi:MinD superfamily P-loop ATPase
MSWLKGIERNKINWGPTIDPEKCTGCGMCLNCGKNVFVYENGKSMVAHYSDCVPGCSTCRSLCEGNAISFPSLKELRQVYKQNEIWKIVKEEMIANGKIPTK